MNKTQVTFGDLRTLASRLRSRATKEQPGHGDMDDGDDEWTRRCAVADACKAVAEEIEGFLQECD